MRIVTQVLNVPFDTFTMEEAVNKIKGFLEVDKKHMICTPNPEIVMEAQKDSKLMAVLRASDMVVPDGIGVVWASKYSQIPLTQRVAAYDLTQRLFKELAGTEESFYFFGGGKGVAIKGAEKMQEMYPDLKVVGIQNGYFDENIEKKIIDDIKKKSPSILLVGLGAPKQEKWIYEHLSQLNIKVAIGVGGSFDVMAGTVKRAPKLFQKLGLEWFYRLVTQPTRWRRMMQLPVFVLHVLKNRKRR